MARTLAPVARYLTKGYWQAPELAAEVMKDGYYLTGDLATVDERGYVFIVDRQKEMIISGGFNVYPVRWFATT